MKTFKLYLNSRKTLLLFTTACLLAGCKKETIPVNEAAASLNIVDALPTSVSLIPVQGTAGPVYYYNIPGTSQYGYYQNFKGAPTVSYGSTFLIGPQAGPLRLYLVQKNADTLVTGGHVSKYMFNQVLNLGAGNAYSLFIMGKDTTTADYLLMQDHPPFHADSTAGIRFVNLSAGSSPISVDILGQANGSEVASLEYKAITDFKNYVATYTIGSYVFEFRDQATGTLLASFTISGVNNGSGKNTAVNNVRFKNFTLALIGQPGGSGSTAQKIIQVNNY